MEIYYNISALIIMALIAKTIKNWATESDKILILSIVVLLIQALRDISLAPLIGDIINIEYSFYTSSGEPLFSRVTDSTAMKAWILMIFYYAFIFLGMFITYYINKKNEIFSADSVSRKHYSLIIKKRGWRIGSIFFCIGLLAEIIVIKYLLQEIDLRSFASVGAIFSTELNLTNPIFNYLRLLIPLAIIGSLTMVAFSAPHKREKILSYLAFTSCIIFEILMGGRSRVVLSVLMLIVVYHFGIKKINLKQLFNYGIVIVLLLIFTNFHRYNLESFWSGPSEIIKLLAIGNTVRLDQVAWIMDTIPGNIPYSGWKDMLIIPVSFVPGLELEGIDNLWSKIIEYYYLGDNPMGGIGGLSFSSPAELYLWAGYSSTLVVAFLAGIFFGLFFLWIEKNKANKFVLIFFAYFITKIFFGGLQTRLPQSLGSWGNFIIPVALIAALTVKSKVGNWLMIILALSGFLFIMWRSDQWILIKGVIMILVTVSILISILVLSKSGPDSISNIN